MTCTRALPLLCLVLGGLISALGFDDHAETLGTLLAAVPLAVPVRRLFR